MRLPFLLLALVASPALASSDDAWAQFRAEVQAACAALAPTGAETRIEVNPFGSESYGAALVVSTTDAGTDRQVCIYDKGTKKAELTAPFAPPETAKDGRPPIKP